MARTSNVVIDTAFANTLESIRTEYESLSDGATLIENITKKFQTIFDEPPIESFQLLTNDDSIDLERLRGIMFAPDEKSVSLYVTCFRSGSTADGDKVRSILLSLVYLVHRYFLHLFSILLHFTMISII